MHLNSKTGEDNRVELSGKVYTKNLKCQNFDPNTRRYTKYGPNEMFINFSIPQLPIDRIDSVFNYFEGVN